jgi:hypothetical protein
MTPPELADGVVLLWHGVDAAELSWTVPSRPRLTNDPPDHLEQRLATLQQQAVAQGRRIESGWAFEDLGSDPVMVHTRGVLSSPYALQCAAFLVRVNHEAPSGVRAVVQLRSHYIQRVGPEQAIRNVREWVDKHLLPLVDGRIRDAAAEWHVHRLDLAADLAGINLTRHHLPRFITRARQRSEWHAPDQSDATHAAARVKLVGRTLTGLSFGTRHHLLCRIYDTERQAGPDAPIRESWRTAGYAPELHGRVFRVEFEIRRAVLREMHTDDAWLPDTPERLVGEHLTALWRYLTGEWLRLHTADPTATRRPPVELWWEALSKVDFDAGPTDAKLGRRQPPCADTARLLSSLTGALTSLGAAWRVNDIDELCDLVAAHVHADRGAAAFALAVRTRVHRWPVPSPRPPAQIVEAGTPETRPDPARDDRSAVERPRRTTTLRRALRAVHARWRARAS